jgi:hypothetical protein
MSVRYGKVIWLLMCSVALQPSGPAVAETVEFVKEYTYRAGEMDSKVSSRSIALQEVKRALLEKLGIYLIAETEVREYRMTKDQITTLTAGVVGTEILQERWDGFSYYLQARVFVDPDSVARQIKEIGKDRERIQELQEARRRVNDALQEAARLREELKMVRSRQAAGGTGIADVNQEERWQEERELRYARAVRDLEDIDVFEGYLFTMKDGSTFIWKEYTESTGNYCHELAKGTVCIPAADVASVRNGEYPEGAEVITTPPLNRSSRSSASRHWKDVQSDNAHSRKAADCQRLFNTLQRVHDPDRYRDENVKYQRTCSGVSVDRSAEQERIQRSRNSANTGRNRRGEDMDRIMRNANDDSIF